MKKFLFSAFCFSERRHEVVQRPSGQGHGECRKYRETGRTGSTSLCVAQYPIVSARGHDAAVMLEPCARPLLPCLALQILTLPAARPLCASHPKPLCRLALPGVPGVLLSRGLQTHRAAGKRFSHGACCCCWCFRLGHPSGIIITWLGAQVLMWLPE